MLPVQRGVVFDCSLDQATLSGSKVVSVVDKSTAGNPFAQMTNTHRLAYAATGLGGQPAMTNGTTSSMTSVGGCPSLGYTIYATAQPSTTGTLGYLNGGSRIVYYNGGFFHFSDTIVDIFQSANTTDPRLLIVTCDLSGNVGLSIDGGVTYNTAVTTGPGATTSTIWGALNSGGTDPFEGAAGSLGLFGVLHTPTEIAANAASILAHYTGIVL